MPRSCDFFVATLTCPDCGKTSPADLTTNMQTYLRDDANMASLAVGARVPIDPERIRQNCYDGYLATRVPEPGDPVRIVQAWECPACLTPANWAEVVVRDGVLESLRPIELGREHFERSHLVTSGIVSIVADLTGTLFSALVEEDLVQLLHDTELRWATCWPEAGSQGQMADPCFSPAAAAGDGAAASPRSSPVSASARHT